MWSTVTPSVLCFPPPLALRSLSSTIEWLSLSAEASAPCERASFCFSVTADRLMRGVSHTWTQRTTAGEAVFVHVTETVHGSWGSLCILCSSPCLQMRNWRFGAVHMTWWARLSFAATEAHTLYTAPCPSEQAQLSCFSVDVRWFPQIEILKMSYDFQENIVYVRDLVCLE